MHNWCKKHILAKARIYTQNDSIDIFLTNLQIYNYCIFTI